MSNYDVTVRIGNVDYTGDTLGTVRAFRGREDIYTEVTAGYCQLQLIDTTGQGFPVQVNMLVEVLVEYENVLQPIFTGNLTDIETNLYSVRTGARAIWTLRASSFLAKTIGRQILHDGAPEEGDNERALRILKAGLSVTWEEFPFLTWAQIPANVTWNNLDINFATFPGPGDYTVAALPPSTNGYNAFALLGQLAASTGGSISELGFGGVLYLSGYSRSDIVAEFGYVPFGSDYVNTADLTTSKQLSDVVNDVEVTWPGGSARRSNGPSLSTFGRRQAVLQTILSSEAQAERRADETIYNLSNPRTKLPSISVRIDAFPPDLEIDALFLLEPSFPFEVGVLPATLGPTPARSFVEGVEWNFGASSRSVRAYLSDAQLSLASERWQDMNPTLAWEDVSATLAWQDARTVTV